MPSTTIWNVNFRAKVIKKFQKHEPSFRDHPPQMAVMTCKEVGKDNSCETMKLIIFLNRKCRLMGCKSFSQFKKKQKINLICNFTTKENLAVTDKCCIKIKNIMSGSVTHKFAQSVNLFKLANYLSSVSKKVLYEPELFQALRITHFNPLCVNVFSSGSCVILGVRKFSIINKLINEIREFINISNAFFPTPLPTENDTKKSLPQEKEARK